MTTKQNRKPKAVSAAYTDNLWSKFEASPAQLDVPTMERIEQVFTSKGLTRRSGLALLTMSGKKLAEAVNGREKAVMLAELAICAGEYRKWLIEFAGLMEAAHIRVSIALCNREDMQEIMREAQARIDAPEIPEEQLAH